MTPATSATKRARPKVSRCGVVIGGTSRVEVEGSTDRSRRHKEYAPDCRLSMGQRAAKSLRVKGPPQRRAVRYWSSVSPSASCANDLRWIPSSRAKELDF